MSMNKIECFKIQLYAINREKTQCILRLVNDRHTVFREPTIIVADPFLFVHDDILYLFYEQKKLYHNGTIMMRRTDDLIHWSEPAEVLRESFHLSYPWVFEKDGHIYMMPETCGDKSIRLYEAANDELTEFKFVRSLLEQERNDNIEISFSDSSIVMRDEIYYLFTTIRSEGVNQLRLFYSRDLMGKYKEHAKSPVCVSNKYGRNAGSLIEHKDGLFRVAQDCEKGYGDNIHVLKVKELSLDNYVEDVLKENIFSKDDKFYRQGGHQLNFVEFKGKKIFVTDAKEYHYFTLNRLLHKVKRLFKAVC